VGSTEGIEFTANRACDNGAGGIVVNSEKQGCSNFTLRGNETRRNGSHGIEVRRSHHGTLENNITSDNSGDQISIIRSSGITGTPD
jgi:parallel beta-helix repeat protein